MAQVVFPLLQLVGKVALGVKNQPANAGSIPRWGISLGKGNGGPLQYSCLENPMDRGASWATVHGVTKSQTKIEQLTHISLCVTGMQIQEGCVIQGVGGG